MASGDFAEIPSIKRGLDQASKALPVESLNTPTKDDLGRSRILTINNVSRLYFCVQTGVDKYEWKEFELSGTPAEATGLTEEQLNKLNSVDNKVDKVDGKGLSSNDFTDEEKEKLSNLSNYDDTDLKNSLDNKVDKVDGKGLSTEDFTTSEKTKLSNLKNYDDTDIKNSLDAKVDKVDGKGLSTEDFTTELKNKLEGIVVGGDGTSSGGNLSDEDRAKLNSIDNKVDKVDGKGLSTEDFTTEEKTKLASLENYDDTDIKNSLDAKVDKEDGKQLSSNDFTDEYKTKIDNFSEYDDTAIKSSLDNKVDKVDGKGLSTEDFTTEEKTKLESLSNYDDTEIKTSLDSKASSDDLSDHVNDTTIHVTQDEKDIWNSATKSRELKQADYDKLTDAEKTDGTVYFITDADSTEDEPTSITIDLSNDINDNDPDKATSSAIAYQLSQMFTNTIEFNNSTREMTLTTKDGNTKIVDLNSFINSIINGLGYGKAIACDEKPTCVKTTDDEGNTVYQVTYNKNGIGNVIDGENTWFYYKDTNDKWVNTLFIEDVEVTVDSGSIKDSISIDPDSKHWLINSVDTGVMSEGYSPQITENANNTDSDYRLDVKSYNTSTNSYETRTTPNLKGADGVILDNVGYFGFRVENRCLMLYVNVPDDAGDPDSLAPPFSLEGQSLMYTVGGTIQYVSKTEI